MANPLNDPTQWQDSDANGQPGASPPITWNDNDGRYEFISSGSFDYDLGLIYIGDGITEPFSFYAAQSYDSDTITIYADDSVIAYPINQDGVEVQITVNPCTTLRILFNTTNNFGPYGIDAYIQPILDLSPTPTPSPTVTPTSSPVTPTPTPIIKPKHMKQMFRRFNDGLLVAREQQYDLLKGFQFQQNNDSNIWEICHNMQSDKFEQVAIVDGVVTDCDVKIIDKCKILLIFSKPTSGYANLLFLDRYPETSLCACVQPTPPAQSVTPTPSVTPTSTPTPVLVAFSETNGFANSESVSIGFSLYSTPVCNDPPTPLIIGVTNVDVTWRQYTQPDCDNTLTTVRDEYCQDSYSTETSVISSGTFSYVPDDNGDGTYNYNMPSDGPTNDIFYILTHRTNMLIIMDLLITTTGGTLNSQTYFNIWGC